MKKQGRQNSAFIGDNGQETTDFQHPTTNVDEKSYQDKSKFNLDYGIQDDRKLPLSLSLSEETVVSENEDRATWGNGLEFLMSCIAMSIGLGNVWRFPFTAYENGGGVFLIPYIIVLFLVGKPFYYLEMIIGQFCSRSSVKIWSAAPGLRGVGWAQMFSTIAVGTYYCSLMSITLYYLIGSFQSKLPWSTCLKEWGDSCIDSAGSYNISQKNGTELITSAELYFRKSVLKEKQSIDDGIGLPDWKLTLCLLLAWGCIFAVLARGMKSSGKASYFLAIFPYIIMISLLVRAVTLDGAVNGIIFFIKPDWDKLFDAHVWYAAVTQCFFSLSVCFGGVVMYSSYNNFRHNIYRDVIVVTTLDTFTSLMAGFTIFGILGNLAHELGTEDISNVVRGGTGLAFVSYPDAIAKFTVLPQLFSVLFFLMLYVLGIGSAIALAGSLITIIRDQFPNLKHIYVVLGTVTFGFCAGIIYCTPGGQFMLELIDYYAASFVVFILATLEITGIFWIYGLENFLDDVEYMLKRRPSAYWRLCWGVITPLLLAVILVYTLISLTPLTYSGISYPDSAHAAGWTICAFGILQVPFWMIYAMMSKRNLSSLENDRCHQNPTFTMDETDDKKSCEESRCVEIGREIKGRSKWNNEIEFLMSCIAISIGFGNIWRFPFTAYENGGGVFLIPYIIVLFLVGKPIYYMEIILGQFSSSSSINVWNVSPGFSGIGWSQFYCNTALMTYYSSLMALTLFFLIASFSAELPWAKCREEWLDYCIDSSHQIDNNTSNITSFVQLLNEKERRSSAELYFLKVVLEEKDSIEDGIGLPSWKLTLCLLVSWISVVLITSQGVKSSGKASYFLAIFPYIILFSLLIRAVTLDGAATGILFFVTPEWSKLFEPSVWYAAVTQCFFSLSVCFGPILTYSSHNDFKHNLYRDVLIVTTLDTLTSFIAGCTIFGILGNLAHKMGLEDINKVVKSGVGLAFISYPDAIAKFNVVPQLFAVLFFVMMFVLGVGSIVGMVSGLAHSLKEKLPNVQMWKIVLCICSMSFAVSTIYVTPGGQFLLSLVDYYGTSFVVFFLASFEITAIMWVYGIENFLNDVEFMLSRRTGSYWRICWFLVTPFILLFIFLYTFATLQPLTYGEKEYPISAHAAGIVVSCLGIFQIPFWMIVKLLKNRSLPLSKNIRKCFLPTSEWGPKDTEHRKDWLRFKEEKEKQRSLRKKPRWVQLIHILINKKETKD